MRQVLFDRVRNLGCIILAQTIQVGNGTGFQEYVKAGHRTIMA
jgi:hypothetical protein